MNPSKIMIVCDPLIDLRGSVRPALFLAKELVAKQFDVYMFSGVISDESKEILKGHGIHTLHGEERILSKNRGLSVAWFEAWLHESLQKLRSSVSHTGDFTTLNFSHMYFTPSLVWYVQGPPSDALKDIESELPLKYRVVYRLLKNFIAYSDQRFIVDMSDHSKLVIANSKFCSSLYEKRGIQVHGIIYPPIDCSSFIPNKAVPSADYVLAYLGKETEFSTIKKIADKGVKIKAFGFKAPYIPKNIANHPNIQSMWNISNHELTNAYSNALFTIFPFTHEPFGYVPLESMACGTPILTYNIQGPSEYVSNEQTGWLVESRDDFIRKAVTLWKKGYSSLMRTECPKIASSFDTKIFNEKWLKLFDSSFTK